MFHITSNCRPPAAATAAGSKPGKGNLPKACNASANGSVSNVMHKPMRRHSASSVVASVSLRTMGKANSYRAQATTATVAATVVKAVNTPNASGVNRRVSTGPSSSGTSCATAPPINSVKMARNNPLAARAFFMHTNRFCL